MFAAAATILASSASRAFTTTTRRPLHNSVAASSLLRSLSSPISRFSIRSMADSAASSSPFKKIQIQRDDTVTSAS